VKALIELLKEIGSAVFAGLFGLIGLLMVNFVAWPLWSADGIGWQAILVAVVFVIVGYFIYRFGEKIFDK